MSHEDDASEEHGASASHDASASAAASASHDASASSDASASRRASASRSLYLLLVFALAIAAVRLWRSPWSASGLGIVPDSVEYAVGAQRLVTVGSYDLEIAWDAYPPRYPPWFSLLLAPAYALDPHELGIGIVPVFLLAMSAVGAAFVIGRRLAGDWGAVASALTLAAFAEFHRDATRIMTDVPAIAFALWSCVMYLRLRRGDGRTPSWLAAGVLCAAASALRVELLALCLPFLLLALREKRRRPASALLFCTPIACMVLATAAYNAQTFGSWTRTGYAFWLPELHEKLANVISPSFLSANIAALGSAWVLLVIVLGCAGAWFMCRRSAEARALLVFFALGALPGSVFHLFYFYQDVRFHLLALALLCVFAGAALATFLWERLPRVKWAIPLLGLATLALPSSRAPVPYRRIVADTLARETPPDAVIITAIDEVYLEPTLVRDTPLRTIVPYSRSVEYAGRTVKEGWIWSGGCRFTHHAIFCYFFDELDPERCVPVTPTIADEDTQTIRDWIREKRAVFLDHSLIPKDYPLERILGDDLELVRVKDYVWLSRIELRH